MKGSTLLRGILLGSVTAAVTVLLTTPQSGDQLRRNVRRKMDTFELTMDDLKQKVEEVKFSIQHLTNEAKATLPQTIEGLKQSILGFQRETEPNRTKLTSEIESIQRSLDQLEEQLAKQQSK